MKTAKGTSSYWHKAALLENMHQNSNAGRYLLKFLGHYADSVNQLWMGLVANRPATMQNGDNDWKSAIFSFVMTTTDAIRGYELSARTNNGEPFVKDDFIDALCGFIEREMTVEIGKDVRSEFRAL